MALSSVDINQKTTSHSTHEHTLYAEKLFYIQDLKITNSLLSSWIAVFLIFIISFLIKKNISLIPSKIQNLFEIIIEKFLEIFDSITGSREKSWNIFPFVFSFFVFILINNWLGIMPWNNTININITENNHEKIIPLFRGSTADINTTFALAIIAILTTHLLGILSIGLWNYLNRFLNIKAILEIPSKIRKNPTILIINPIKLFVGLLEIIGELAKIASLSFRLFGNIFAGEVLLASMLALFAWFLPIPFIFMEILVGFIQALIFSILVLVYVNVATSDHDEH